MLAAIAHAAIGFGLVGIGFLLSLAIAGFIWLIARRSRYVREQSDRAGRYQLLVLLVNIVVVALWVAGLALLLYLGGWQGWLAGGWRAVLWGLLAIILALVVPFFLVWYVGTIGYGLYAALRALGGADFHYPPPPWRWRKWR